MDFFFITKKNGSGSAMAVELGTVGRVLAACDAVAWAELRATSEDDRQ
jgi:hypothetical protein